MAARDVLASPRTSYVAALFLAIAAVAFWPPYFSKLPAAEIYVHYHAAGVVAWMGLLIVQPLLIRRNLRPLHRRLGALSYALVPYIVVTSVLLAHSRLDPVSAPTFRADATDMYLAWAAIVLFAVCYGLAIAFRRNMPVHARFMTATLVTLIDPLMFRLLFFYSGREDLAASFPILGYGVADALLLALAVADRKHPTARWAFPLLLASSSPSISATGRSPRRTSGSRGWRRFAAWPWLRRARAAYVRPGQAQRSPGSSPPRSRAPAPGWRRTGRPR